MYTLATQFFHTLIHTHTHLQLKTYQDDYTDERKDRQRMSEEKRCLAVKHEAEVTSLKLQLERTKAELNHYMSEANRLSQQLRMKNQQEEEQYKKHLESKVCVRACVHACARAFEYVRVCLCVLCLGNTCMYIGGTKAKGQRNVLLQCLTNQSF